MQKQFRAFNVAPKRDGDLSCIRRPPINVANFEVKLITLTMVNNYQFGGLLNEDPNQHLNNFFDVCELVKYN